MLVTANRLRVGIPIVDHAKIFLISNVITMQNLVLVTHAVRAHVGGPKNFADAGAPPS